MQELYVPQERYMRRALELAEYAASLGEVPVGAVVVHKPTNRIIGEGWNLRESGKSPLAHAEIMAIDQASRTLGGWRVIDSAIYVTLEPCPMCAGAIINSRIKDVYFGALDPKAGACGSVVDLFTVEKFNHHPHAIRGLYRDQCAQMLKDFFRAIRQKQKEAKQAQKEENN